MADLWDARDALHRLLKPRSALLSLRYDLENGQARQIDGASPRPAGVEQGPQGLHRCGWR